MRAYFTEGEPIGDTETLARLALEVGLPEDEVRDVAGRRPLRGRGPRGRAHGHERSGSTRCPSSSSIAGWAPRARTRPRRSASCCGAAGRRGCPHEADRLHHPGPLRLRRAAARGSRRLGHRPRGVPRSRVLLAHTLLRPRRGDRQSRRAHARHRHPRQRGARHRSPRSSRRRSWRRCPSCSRTPTPTRNDDRRARRASARTAASRRARASSAPRAGATSPRSIGCRRGRSGRSPVPRTTGRWPTAAPRRPRPSSPRCTPPATPARRRRRCPGGRASAGAKRRGLGPARGRARRAPSAQALRVWPRPQRRGCLPPLDNVARGYGTRDFPVWEHTVAPEPVAMPVEARLIAELGRTCSPPTDSTASRLPSRP